MLASSLLVACLTLAQVSADVEAAADTKQPNAGEPAIGQAGAAAVAAGTAEAKKDLPATVQALVKKLDSSAIADRESAEKELIELGSQVLPLLPAVSSRTPAEVKNRLTRIRAALLQTAVESSTKTSFITLSGSMPFSKAIAEIGKQSGNSFIDYREQFNQEQPDPTIDVAIENKPFWEAVDIVLDKAGLTIYNYDEEASAIAYTARGEGAVDRVGRATYSGIFRIEPIRVQATRDLRNPASRTLRLTLDISWEPRVRPIVLEQPLAEVSAVDEEGNAIEVDGSEGNPEVSVEGSNAAVEMEYLLKLPPRSVSQVKSLKGKLTAVVLGRIEAFEFDNLDKTKAAEQQRGGVTVTVDSCRKNDEIYDVQMRVRFDKAANALESHRGWIYNNECYLASADGTRIENAGLEATLVDTNEVGLSYKFDLGDAKSAAGLKFVYKTPAAILKIPVEFELPEFDLP